LKPRSLLGITLELLCSIERPGPYPADARVGRFFRARRYLGSRDRRFIGDAVYAWLRFHQGARTRWRLWADATGRAIPPIAPPSDAMAEPSQTPDASAGEPTADGDDRSSQGPLLLDLLAAAKDAHLPWDFGQTRDAAAELIEDGLGDWHGLVSAAIAGDFVTDAHWPADPVERFCAEASLPRWIGARMLEQLGEQGARDLAPTLNESASVDVRVNLRRVERERARRRLQSETELEIEPTHFSPLGLRLGSRRNLTSTTASRKAWIEMQDEGSQIAVLCADASPGMKVIDACAGGGGKALALADILFRDEAVDRTGEPTARGRITACEIDRRKLDELRRRAREARVQDFIDYALIAEEGDLTKTLSLAHLVVVDAPCTGVGTLRRNPELKMRWDDEDLERFQSTQIAILERFAPLVRKRGRLVYITCSFLREECEDVVEAFEAAHPEFESSPSFFASKCLPSGCIDAHKIRLSPMTTQTDAFFIASWRRRKDSQIEA